MAVKWYDYLIPGGVSSRQAEDRQAAFGAHLGNEPYEISPMIANPDISPIGVTPTGENRYAGKGLLADPNLNPERLRLAHSMLGLSDDTSQSIASNLIATEMGNSNAISKLNMQQDIHEQNANRIANFIAGDPGIFPAPSMPSRPNPATPTLASPVSLNPSPVATTSPQVGTTGRVAGAPGIEPSVRTTGPASISNLSVGEAYSMYNQEMQKLAPFAAIPAMQPFYQQQAKQIGAKYGFGEGASPLAREWRDAQRLDNYQGSMEDYAAMKRQTIMKDQTNAYDLPVGEKAAEWYNPWTGKTAKFTQTPKQLEDSGYQLMSSAQQDNFRQIQGALNLNKQLGDLLFGADGKGGIYKDWDDQKDSLMQRAGLTAQTAWNRLTQSNPDITKYERLAQGTMAQTIRAMGEKGALAEGDVQRGSALLVDLFPADSKEVAMGMHKELQSIFTKGNKNSVILFEAQRAGLVPIPKAFDDNGVPKFLNPKTGETVIWQED